jgi:hypothetical protein
MLGWTYIMLKTETFGMETSSWSKCKQSLLLRGQMELFQSDRGKESVRRKRF